MLGNDSDPQSANEDRLNLEIKWFRRIAFTLPFMLMVGYFGWFNHNDASLSINSGDWGTFGDFIGGFLNPIFALIAFYWLTRSIQLQLHELKETRKAFQESADAQAKMVREQERANRTQIQTAYEQQRQSRIQIFESLFFELLSQKSEVTKDVRAGSEASLRGCISNSSSRLSDAEKKITDLLGCAGKESIKDHIIFFKAYSKFDWQEFYSRCIDDYFGSYFRICYQVLKVIDRTSGLEDGKNVVSMVNSFIGNFVFPEIVTSDDTLKKPSKLQKRYADIFRAGLSSYELEALFFNGLTARGQPKLKPLIEKYGLFEHMLTDAYRLRETRHRLVNFAYQYEKSAFEESMEWKAYFDKIEMAGIDGVDARKNYGINEMKYQEWKASKTQVQAEEQDGEAN